MSDVLDFAAVMEQIVAECGYVAYQLDADTCRISLKKSVTQSFPDGFPIAVIIHHGGGHIAVTYFDKPNYNIPTLPELAPRLMLFLGDPTWMGQFKAAMVKSTLMYEESERGHTQRQ